MVSSEMGPTIYLHYSRVKAHNTSIQKHPQGYEAGDFRDLVYSLGHLMEGTVEMVGRIHRTAGIERHLTIDHKFILEDMDKRLKRYEFLAALCRTKLQTLRDLEAGLPAPPNTPQILIENPEGMREEWIRRAKIGS